MPLSIQEFCDKHNACAKGREWALNHCSSMQEAWDTTTRVDWLRWIATQPGVLKTDELRWIALKCAKLVEHLMPEASRKALGLVECYLLGLVSRDELQQARDAAAVYAAAYAADYDAAYAAVVYAAAAVYAAADVYAAYTAADAVYAAAYAADAAADADANIKSQIMSIFRSYTPNFN